MIPTPELKFWSRQSSTNVGLKFAFTAFCSFHILENIIELLKVSQISDVVFQKVLLVSCFWMLWSQVHEKELHVAKAARGSRISIRRVPWLPYLGNIVEQPKRVCKFYILYFLIWIRNTGDEPNIITWKRLWEWNERRGVMGGGRGGGERSMLYTSQIVHQRVTSRTIYDSNQTNLMRSSSRMWRYSPKTMRSFFSMRYYLIHYCKCVSKLRYSRGIPSQQSAWQFSAIALTIFTMSVHSVHHS